MTADAPALAESTVAAALALLALTPLALAGLALINAGLGRSRSAAQSLLGSLMLVAVSAIAFALVGAGLTGFTGGPSHAFLAAGKPWNWIGGGALLLRNFETLSSHAQLGLLFDFLAAALAALIPWGSGADRLRIVAGCAIAGIFGAFVFPFAAHWVWADGWLAQLGVNFSLGTGFTDPGGAAVIHMMGGLGALALVWITGPRKGKFPQGGFATAIPGHNAVYILFGCVLAWTGFTALNAAGSLLWMHVAVTTLPLTVINTLVSASGAVVATFAVTRIRFGKPDASLCANGWLAGLVASSGTAPSVSVAASLFIGVVAGVFTPLLVEFLELAVAIDDPSGGITVHGAGGLWGVLAAGIFSLQRGQFIAQLVGVSALVGLGLPVLYLVLRGVNRILPIRADLDGERIGMDLHELGGGAYPEFVIHRDDSYR